jgi:hypothetical protein
MITILIIVLLVLLLTGGIGFSRRSRRGHVGPRAATQMWLQIRRKETQ